MHKAGGPKHTEGDTRGGECCEVPRSIAVKESSHKPRSSTAPPCPWCLPPPTCAPALTDAYPATALDHRPSLPYLVTLSLIPSSRSSCSGWIPTRINYGLNKLRFPAPVPFGARLRAKATILDLRDVLADVAVTIRYALGDRRRPPTRVRRRIARRGVPTQLRRHHRDVYRLTFSKSPRRSVRLSMDQPSSAGPAPAASTHPSVGEDGAAIRTCRISEQSRRNLHGVTGA